MSFLIKDDNEKVHSLSSLTFLTPNTVDNLDPNTKYMVTGIYALDKDNKKNIVYSSDVIELRFYQNIPFTVPAGYNSMDAFLVGGGGAGFHFQSSYTKLGETDGEGYGGNGGETIILKKYSVKSGDVISIKLGEGGCVFGIRDGNRYSQYYTKEDHSLLEDKTELYVNGEIVASAHQGQSNYGSAGGGWKYKDKYFIDENSKYIKKNDGYRNGEQVNLNDEKLWLKETVSGKETIYKPIYYGRSQNRNTKLFGDEDSNEIFSGGGASNKLFNGGEGGGAGKNNGETINFYNTRTKNFSLICGTPFTGGGGCGGGQGYNVNISSQNAVQRTAYSGFGGCGFVVIRLYSTNIRSKNDKIVSRKIGYVYDNALYLVKDAKYNNALAKEINAPTLNVHYDKTSATLLISKFYFDTIDLSKVKYLWVNAKSLGSSDTVSSLERRIYFTIKNTDNVNYTSSVYKYTYGGKLSTLFKRVNGFGTRFEFPSMNGNLQNLTIHFEANFGEGGRDDYFQPNEIFFEMK